MKKIVHISTILILLVSVTSCDRIKNKSEQIAIKVKEKTINEIREQSKRVINKVFPPFDHDQPDTENNKKKFTEFLKVEITSDVKNIYCFDEAIGIDASYMFAFNCDSTTSRRIISTHNLTVDTINLNNGFALQREFEWWDEQKIKSLQKYSWTNGNQYFKYFWYDSENEKGYFFDFDM